MLEWSEPWLSEEKFFCKEARYNLSQPEAQSMGDLWYLQCITNETTV